ncbi:MAG: LysR family transcriptional regulator [Verrucomicrobia bacterium]|nr:LysR family transcriptional regulator [Verrucomicrobiota bacterium]
MEASDLELRHIRYFVATSEALSFTRAARQLNVSQPALSHSIFQLEERLGNKLFERSVKGIRLTPAGKVFEKTAQRVLREISAGAQLIAESSGQIAGEIRLGFVNSVNIFWLPMMIGRFLQKYPAVKFSVESIDISELESRLLDEKLDLGIGFLERKRQSLKTLELFVENLVVIASAKLPTKKFRSMSLQEVTSFPLVLLRSGFCTREIIDTGLDGRDSQPKILAEFDSIDAIVSCVQEVAAISVLPEHACRWEAYPGIRIIPLKGDCWKRAVGLIIPQLAAPLPTVSCFVDFLRNSTNTAAKNAGFSSAIQ